MLRSFDSGILYLIYVAQWTSQSKSKIFESLPETLSGKNSFSSSFRQQPGRYGEGTFYQMDECPMRKKCKFGRTCPTSGRISNKKREEEIQYGLVEDAQSTSEGIKEKIPDRVNPGDHKRNSSAHGNHLFLSNF